MSQQDLWDRYDKAKAYLAIKMDKVPSRVISKPTIEQLLTGASLPFKKSMPDDLRLEFLFEHYDLLKASDFRVQKGKQHFDISRLLFYFQIDSTHSFSSSFDQIRYNLVLMVLLICSPDAAVAHNVQASHDFRGAFILAWIEGLQSCGVCTFREQFLQLWANSPYDFIEFGSAQRTLLKNALSELKKKMPSPVMTPEKFWEGGISQKEWEEWGPKLALQWCFAEEARKFTENQRAEAWMATQPEALVNAFSGIGLNREPWEVDLARVDWNSPLIKALLTEHDMPGMVVHPKIVDKNAFWMPADKAVSLMLAKTKDLELLLEELKL